eukprot:TRINITY_DN17309_c0_g1_i1.p1 TRINITY_DN17309_c0_g1~~TRINITY_DN17309_c0_g1_i1.p1  ORF type:complete len:952 (-),score=239.03 TRINITY_DN17309_c0_g1_i1:137-2992(-)
MAPKRKSDDGKDDEMSEDPAAEESKKRKAEDKKDDGPRKEPKKEAKLEEAEVVEREGDCVADKRPALKTPVIFDPADTTLNAICAAGGKFMMAHADGGLQYLIAGARANIGLKTGRYLFEVKVVEMLNPLEAVVGARRSSPTPRQLVRIGFSLSGSDLILGETTEGICFDSEGTFIADGAKVTGRSQRFARDQVMGVLLNLDATSSNANTISLFRDGVRITEPQPLPMCLQGKTLYPHVAYRNVSMQINFGPQLLRGLPFKCRSIQGAAQADVVVAPSTVPKDGRYDVLLPVAFPDEGTFDWLNDFLSRNPHFVELSDRKIIEWASKSGIVKGKGGWRESNDKPEFNFGIPGLDDWSIQRVIRTVAPLVPRHYVVMEVKANLIAAERAEVLKRFNPAKFRRIAHVMMGEPTAEYKRLQQSLFLKEKQEKMMLEWTARKAEREKKREYELRQRQLEEMRKKAEEQRKKTLEEAKRKVEELQRKQEEEKKRLDADRSKDAGEKGESAEGATEAAKVDGDDSKLVAVADAEKGESKEDSKDAKEVAKAVAVEERKEEEKTIEDVGDVTMESGKEAREEEEEEDPPHVTLTAEQESMKFRPQPQSDLTASVLSQSFAHFTIPEQSEGFDDLRFEWQSAAVSKEYLKTWILEKKITSRIEDLQPSWWFLEKNKDWHTTFKHWELKQTNFKAAAAKKQVDKKPEGGKDADETKEDDEAEGDDLDIFSVEDVCDVGNGEPLFAAFGFEDWAMLQLRYELYLMVQAYKKDVNDPERIGIHDSHLTFYYAKYFHKNFSPKHFGHNTNQELVDMVKDTVTINPRTLVLASQLSDDVETLEIFVKLTEEQRRERQRRIDAGDETARLKFSAMAMQQPKAAAPPPPSAPAATMGGVGALGGSASPGATGLTTAGATMPGGAGLLGAGQNWRPAGGRWPGAQTAYAPRQPGQWQAGGRQPTKWR